MKNLILRTLPALCLAGMLMSAVAQTAPAGPPDDTNVPAMPDQPAVVAVPADAASSPDAPAAPADQIIVMPPQAPSAWAPEIANPANPGAAGAPTDAAAAQPQVQSAPGSLRQGGPGNQTNSNSASSASAESTPMAFVPPAAGTNGSTNPDELRLNFRNAPLDMVLNYLSDAAGFIIVLDTQVRGNVSVISSHPMTRNEAVDLLNAVLNQNGYAAIREGRTLTIVDKNDAKTRDIPVVTGNDPSAIPRNAEIVTQIIPIRFVEARQLVTDLSSFVSPQATIVANEAGNSIVITDTQSNIRHLTEIIRAIDNSAEGETEIRVFHLTHASPADVANELGQIFPSSNGSGNNNQTPIRFGGGGGGPGGFFQRMMAANGGGGGNNSQNDRVQKQSQVVAVADPRTSSVIVTASKDLMGEIAGMMDQLDVTSTRDQKVFVYHLNNGDPQQTLQVLQNMFQSSGGTGSRSSSSSASQNSALQTRETQNATSQNTPASGTSTTFGAGNSRGTGAGGF